MITTDDIKKNPKRYKCINTYKVLIYKGDGTNEDDIKECVEEDQGKVIRRFGLVFVRRRIHQSWYTGGLREGTLKEYQDKETGRIEYELEWHLTSNEFKRKYKKYLRVNLINPEEFESIEGGNI